MEATLLKRSKLQGVFARAAARARAAGWGLLPAFAGHRLLYLFSCFFFILFCYLFFASFLFPNSDLVRYSAPLSCLLAALAGLGLWGWWRLAGRLCARPGFYRRRGLWVALFLLALLPLQGFLFFQVYYQPGWDVSVLTESAYWLAQEKGLPPNFIEYFACYPNNVTLLMVWAYLFKLLMRVFHYYDYLFAAILVSAVMVNAAVYFTFKVADRVLGGRRALTLLAPCLPLLCFAPWLTNPYSDTMSILFPVLALWLWLLAREPDRGRWQKLALLALCGGAVAFGMRIKPTVFIILIALLAAGLLCGGGRRAFLSTLKAAAVTGLAFLCVALPLDRYCTRVMVNSGVSAERIEQVKYPLTHFLMMGMQKQVSPFDPQRYQYGKWSAVDTAITAAQPGQQAKMKANLEVVRQRLAEFGPLGYLRFLNDKARWVLGDGTMYFGGEVPTSGCFQQTGIARFFQQFFWQKGRFYPALAHLLQAVWMVVVALCWLPLFKKRDDYAHPAAACCRLAAFGILLFILLFEGRSRYLINFLPIYILLAGFALPAEEQQVKE